MFDNSPRRAPRILNGAIQPASFHRQERPLFHHQSGSAVVDKLHLHEEMQ